MKSKMYLIYIILIFASSSFGQFITGYGMKFGMVLSQQKFQGNQLSQVPPSTFNDLDTRTGPIMGIFLEFYEKHLFNLYSEINYHQRGAERDFELVTVEQPEGTGKNYTLDILMHECIELNLAGKFTYRQEFINFYFLMGPTLNFLIKNKITAFFIPDEINKTTPGVLIGSGFELPKLISSNLIFEVRYNFDISTAAENKKLKMKYQIWELLMGIRI